ncbi:MAG: protein kinase domain-containing protein [Planctomycetaceae bacterium]
MSDKTLCPTAENLSHFLAGRLGEADSSYVEQHLNECSDCQTRAEQPRPRDALLTALAGGRPTWPDELESTIEAFIQRVARQPVLRVGRSDGQGETFGSVAEQTPPAVRRPDAVPTISPDEYELRGVLGRGGMGTVYEGFDPKLRRRVAIKVMQDKLAREPHARERFLREARAAAAIQHENIVAVHFVGELTTADGNRLPYLVMPLLSGQTLEMLLRERGALPDPLLREIGRQIARGLRAAHEHGLVHRDIKPSNIWLEGNWEFRGVRSDRGEQVENVLHVPEAIHEWGTVKILDFGLVRSMDGEVEELGHGSIVGTPTYMAPEQAAGQAIDARVDLFSLGCVLYRMATGQPAFQGEDVLAALHSIAHDEPPPVRQLNPERSVELESLIHRLLAKNPADRPSSARQVFDELRAVANCPSVDAGFDPWPSVPAAGK